MAISKEQIASLLKMITVTEPDDLDCEGCFEHLAEFAETKLAQLEVPEALKAVERHMEQCPCCEDEYNTLLDGIRGLEGESN